MSVRLVISDVMWGRIEPLMPADPIRGRRWAEHRRTLEAIAWKYRTCAPWRDLPEELGSFKTAHKRLLRWAIDGTWARIFAAVLASADADGDIGWAVSVDSTVCRAHQHAAGARKGDTGRGEPADHALGRSRGGLGTKIHLASDSNARPLAIFLTAGQAGDAPAFTAVMAAIRVPRTVRGRPRTRPDVVLADRAYSSRAIRAHLRERHVRAVIPQPVDQVRHRERRGSNGGRPPAFDADAYKGRNTVERCIACLKQWRGLAMRCDKLAVAYQAALHLAAILIWVRR
ncbi:IS5 family transposase [Streptomyces sp. JL7001]|uniref:IS5 family transposase n=1 Tax=Streptomyces sp. JL7001 TaxID=3445784 RepID=UPI0024A28B6E|nr:DDE transposase [Streptomyces lavendulae subsp. lavendulae]